ncbi:MAG TPA: HD domain-containing protein, partial [Spirochaetales bacterium]|nr:HD domain-containing protein [Spirochaetales bacterium]
MDDIWPRLGIAFDEPVRDPLWRDVMMPTEFEPILTSPDFIKLSRILQLGPTHLVYPGATHTRRAHSIGVFELAKRSLATVLSRSGPVAGLDGAAARGFLVAALCHDLGHFPYAHSLKELPLRDHESLTADIVRGSLRPAVEAAGADPDLVAAIVDQGLPAPAGSSAVALRLFRSMLSGVLDPDKLDYLNRDAWACGVPYGQQDVDFVLQQLGLDESGRPGVAERGVMAVEAVLFSKYQMYRAVYWHRTVRAATAMIK